jgi:hypothetical protein
MGGVDGVEVGVERFLMYRKVVKSANKTASEWSFKN